MSGSRPSRRAVVEFVLGASDHHTVERLVLVPVHKRLHIVYILHVDFDESAVDSATHSWEVGHLVKLVHHLPALVLILWPLHCALEQLPLPVSQV